MGSPTELQGSRTSFIQGVVTVPPNERILAGAGGRVKNQIGMKWKNGKKKKECINQENQYNLINMYQSVNLVIAVKETFFKTNKEML